MNFIRTRSSVLLGSIHRSSYSCFTPVGSTSISNRSTDNKQSLPNICSVRLFSNSPSSRMKFVQFNTGSDSKQRLGVLSSDGTKVADISNSFSGDLITLIKSGTSLDAVKAKVEKASNIPLADVRLLSPVTNPQKILCVGLNYRGHCEEQNKPIPKEPMFFSKYASTIVGPFDGVIAHSITDQIDWEVELAVIIGKEAKHVSRANAMDYVFGYTVAQDISARDWQKTRNGGQFLIGKSMDTFCPLGPAVVHKSVVSDPYNLVIKCSVNGVEKQKGNTNELVFRIDDIIERATQSITLVPGDVILTGTPAGVGMHRNPPEFLKVGDVIDSEIETIGQIKNKVTADQ
ncbi:fumarylacetoacetate hydrolase domain-containing protein 2 [Wyeomyia smithii]|uniref:fumarylacetoacetate hydrolase domain-containing protein 2 n=1 Tax=Wyeomyia smithii TaxID=174621 RepID=UPI002467B55A|nr:fumarylacetoacetate hydrolase domain-containing protein 2 [Wyeomyia smithii]XP_055536067.1 fumarylacetoacetate hydrolase domain-containing protein 2 [Wyeomyia smithii]